jgi:hypothetical protein
MLVILVGLLAFALLVTMTGYFLSINPRETGVFYSDARSSRRNWDTETVRNPRMRQVTALPSRSGRRLTTTQNLSRRSRVMLIPAWGSGLSLGRRGTGERIPWSIVVIGLVSVCILGLFTFNAIFPHNAILVPTLFANSSSLPTQQSSQPPKFFGASKALQRIGQLNPAQYNSTQDYNIWAYSTCSTAAMTEVFDAYGKHYRIADVLKVEASINEITPGLGLVSDVGIQHTAAQFGFNTTWGYNLSLAKIIGIANSGEPVIVGWPPSKYPGGHLVVVIGGNATTVFLADSSLFDRTSLTYAQFMKWWGGFSAVITPA